MFKGLRLRVRLMLAILATVLVVLIATGLYGHWFASTSLTQQVLESARRDMALRVERIEGYLGGVRRDLRLLAGLDSVRRALGSPGRDGRRALEGLTADFATFVAGHAGVSQARFLDAAGMEVVRVEAGILQTLAVRRHQLQNKADRYYFAETMRLASGSVYVSRVDLNREWGKLQLPETPTVRFATPVFRADGSRAGVVVLNLPANDFTGFVRSAAKPSWTYALIDQDGYYMAHSDGRKEFGRATDRATGHRAIHDYPGLAIRRGPGEVGSDGSGHIRMHRVMRPAGEGGPTWTLLYDVPRMTFFSSVWTFRRQALMILGLASVLALLAGTALARRISSPILELTAEVRRAGKGPSGLAPAGGDEIAELATAFREMRAFQDAIARENAALCEDLAARRRELEALVGKLLTTEEEERRALASNLHDGLQQILVGVRLHLGNHAARSGLDGGRQGHSLEFASAGVDAALAELRQVVGGLVPASLDQDGLGAAVREYLEALAATWPVEVECDIPDPDRRFPGHLEAAGFRIIQEAIGNARKYSGTKRLRVTLRGDERELRIEVRDWGDGFDASGHGGSRFLGLVAMNERARLLGGDCKIEIEPGSGATVVARLPLA